MTQSYDFSPPAPFLYFVPTMHYWILLFLMPAALTAFAQKSPCDDPAQYAPLNPAYMPLKRVRLCVHVIQKNDGTGNFQNTAEDLDFIRKIIRHANHFLERCDTMSLPTPSPYIPDSRIRFVLDSADVYFHRDDEFWDMYKGGKAGLTYSMTHKAYKKYVLKPVGIEVQTGLWPFRRTRTLKPEVRWKEEAIHLFFGEGGKTGCLNRGVANGFGVTGWVACCNFHHFYKERGGNFWQSGSTVRHELGHIMGLHHPMNYAKKPSKANDYCDDTPTYPRNSGQWGSCDSCSNNLMDYGPEQAAMTACQMGRMHFYLTAPNGTAWKALIPDHCDYHVDAPMIIEAGQSAEWNHKQLLWGDLILREGATLTVRCTLHLPPKARIILQKGARLIVDGGVVTNTCSDKPWGGVKYHIPFSERPSAVVLRNGGRLVHDTGRFAAQFNAALVQLKGAWFILKDVSRQPKR